MIQDIYFATPQLLWLIPLVLIVGAAYVAKRGRSLMALSRIAIFCLIIAAAADPYVVQTRTEQGENPSITIIDDRTGSMGIFDPGVAGRLNGALPNSRIQPLSGDSTPLGDAIVGAAATGDAIVLVTDGYRTEGRPLDEALSVARASNSTVFAIQISPMEEDTSVEVSGTNTAVAGEDYTFNVIIRSSDTFEGDLAVYADDSRIHSTAVTANGTFNIRIPYTFRALGTHTIRAEISGDSRPQNDIYTKAVYVVPKPDVLLVAREASPLSQILSDLYDLTTISYPAQLGAAGTAPAYKAVVIDDMPYNPAFSALNPYLRNGGGLVVVGGENSYEYGEYYHSPFEDLLPVRSVPSTFEGGKVVILIMDISFSILQTTAADRTPLLDYEKSLAIELLNSPDFQDYRVGVVVFGTRAYVVSSPVPLSRGKEVLVERITSLWPTGTEESYLDSGLQLSWEMLNVTGGRGEVIVFSDGRLENYPGVYARSIQMIRAMNATTRLIEVHAFEGAGGMLDDMAEETGAQYVPANYPSGLTTAVQELPEAERQSPEEVDRYQVTVSNQNHYITRDLTVNANITGFNDVTPKPGSAKLLALADGKPVLSVWRYGLGRAASLTTDDGLLWGSEMYAPENSEAISAAVNWAIGDPRPDDQRIDSEDGWLGTPLSITITSLARPEIEGAAVERVGEDRYTATLTPTAPGIYYIGDYGIAVNYPLEYSMVGFNPDLPRLIRESGGRIFTEGEALSSLSAEARRLSSRTVQERTSRRDVLLIAALAIFLSEVILRRLSQIRRRDLPR